MTPDWNICAAQNIFPYRVLKFAYELAGSEACCMYTQNKDGWFKISHFFLYFEDILNPVWKLKAPAMLVWLKEQFFGTPAFTFLNNSQ